MLNKFISLNITRRRAQVILGIYWLIAGCLQLQSQMFTSNFISKVINPITQNQPLFISGPINFASHIFLINPVLFNAFIALIQLCLGIFIIWPKSTKYALAGSIFWAIFVWFFGEAMGQLWGGHNLLLMGAPGAALIYALIAIGIMPKNSKEEKPDDWLILVWVAVWLLGSVLQLVNGQNTSNELAGLISGMAGNGAPQWLSALDTGISNAISGLGNWFIALLAAVQAAIALLVLCPNKFVRIIIIELAGILLAAFWVVGQNLGGYYTGYATDVNSAPLIILLGLIIVELKFESNDYIDGIV